MVQASDLDTRTIICLTAANWEIGYLIFNQILIKSSNSCRWAGLKIWLCHLLPEILKKKKNALNLLILDLLIYKVEIKWLCNYNTSIRYVVLFNKYLRCATYIPGTVLSTKMSGRSCNSHTPDIFLSLDIPEISQEESLRARNGSQNLLLVVYWRFLKLSWELNAPQNFQEEKVPLWTEGVKKSGCLVCSECSSIAQIRHN